METKSLYGLLGTEERRENRLISRNVAKCVVDVTACCRAASVSGACACVGWLPAPRGEPVPEASWRVEPRAPGPLHLDHRGGPLACGVLVSLRRCLTPQAARFLPQRRLEDGPGRPSW